CPENPKISRILIRLPWVAASVYQATALQDKYQAAVAIAASDAEALQPFHTLSSAVFWRMSYFWSYGRQDRATNEALQLARQTSLPGGPQYFCGLILYRRASRADLQEARAALEAGLGNAIIDLVRCCLLADLEGPRPALEAYRQMVARGLEARYQLLSYTVLFLLGRKYPAQEASRHDRGRCCNLRL